MTEHRITRKLFKIDSYILRRVRQALNCLSIHATYCVIVAGASPGETKMWATAKLLVTTSQATSSPILLDIKRKGRRVREEKGTGKGKERGERSAPVYPRPPTRSEGPTSNGKQQLS